MPNQYVNKVELADGTSLIDISDTTAIPADVAQGKYFYGANGEKKVGTASGGTGAIGIQDTLDSAGGTIRTITAVDLSNDTVAADKLLQGYTAHGATGAPITGTYVPQTGIDLPTFTATQDGGGNITITCDKTYAECAALANDDCNAAILDAGASSGMALTAWGANYITYAQTQITPDISIGTISITIHSDNTITFSIDNINSRDSTSLLVSGATVTAEAGWYETNISKSVATGSATPASTISATGASVSTGTNTMTLSKSVANTPQVTAGYVSSGTQGNSSVSLTASVTTQGAQTLYPSTTDQTISSGRYLTGTQTIKAVTVSGLSADKVLSGTTVNIGDSADADRIMSVSGSVVIQHYYTGSSAPSSSLGVDGDIYLQT